MVTRFTALPMAYGFVALSLLLVARFSRTVLPKAYA
jgi:hypothetical protein